MHSSFRELMVKAKRLGVGLMNDFAERIDPIEREFRRVWPTIDSIEGLLVSPIQERWLFKTARSLPDQSIIVEIGSFKGRSTACLAYGCVGSKKHVYAIDTFCGNDSDCRPGETLSGGSVDGICRVAVHQGEFFDEFLDNIRRCGLGSYVTPIRGLSSGVGKNWDKPIDFIFIDGSHQFEDVLADFENFFPRVKSGGVIAFHDVVGGWPGPLRVWEDLASRILAETGRCSTIAFGKKA